MTLDQVKKHLRLTVKSDYHDSQLLDAIDAATEYFEQDTDQALLTQTFQLRDFSFPERREPIILHKRQVQSVTQVCYRDPDGRSGVLNSVRWDLDKARRMIFPVGADWPSVEAQNNRAVEIDFVAGYGDSPDNVPRICRQAVLLLVGKWFADPMMESADAFSGQHAYDRIVDSMTSTFYAS